MSLSNYEKHILGIVGESDQKKYYYNLFRLLPDYYPDHTLTGETLFLMGNR